MHALCATFGCVCSNDTHLDSCLLGILGREACALGAETAKIAALDPEVSGFLFHARLLIGSGEDCGLLWWLVRGAPMKLCASSGTPLHFWHRGGKRESNSAQQTCCFVAPAETAISMSVAAEWAILQHAKVGESVGLEQDIAALHNLVALAVVELQRVSECPWDIKLASLLQSKLALQLTESALPATNIVLTHHLSTLHCPYRQGRRQSVRKCEQHPAWTASQYAGTYPRLTCTSRCSTFSCAASVSPRTAQLEHADFDRRLTASAPPATSLLSRLWVLPARAASSIECLFPPWAVQRQKSPELFSISRPQAPGVNEYDIREVFASAPGGDAAHPVHSYCAVLAQQERCEQYFARFCPLFLKTQAATASPATRAMMALSRPPRYRDSTSSLRFAMHDSDKEHASPAPAALTQTRHR
ncbi:hypothetical protein BDU57DRAFT_529580 [Ampelomyces quisqualis]|uniref:Uncharacterized protein n=1 Tax=Ampelomyces quisqualis TaxID=50730 RepID=A0A6A5QR92_AMPQU|nr:hypothetical protein BDU57DRAFT_529580 [Ampelomyces quisqualis]